jgi:hypothetical protein
MLGEALAAVAGDEVEGVYALRISSASCARCASTPKTCDVRMSGSGGCNGLAAAIWASQSMSPPRHAVDRLRWGVGK